MARRASSAAGPNSCAAGTVRLLSSATGPSQNGRKPPARNRTPSTVPRPSSWRVKSLCSTP